MTPMMEQYLSIKKEYDYCILFYRLGDFYEMFFDDAVLVSKELSLVLTSRDCGDGQKAPMCGVPYHSSTTYINKLIEKGYKIAICEQLEAPIKGSKQIVKRDVKRIVTRGTNIESETLDSNQNNYLLSIFQSKNGFGWSFCDIATGEFYTSDTKTVSEKEVIDLVARVSPIEIICNPSFKFANEIKKCFSIDVGEYQTFPYDLDIAVDRLKDHFKLEDIELYSRCSEDEIISSGALISYLYETQKNDLTHITTIEAEKAKCFMHLDMSSRRNLELTQNIVDRTQKGSLFSVINNTVTAKGQRLLREYLEKPLIDKNMILDRQSAVVELTANINLRDSFRDEIRGIIDVDKILAKITYQQAKGKDLLALKNSLENLPFIEKLLKVSNNDLFNQMSKKFNTHQEIYKMLDESINEDCGNNTKDGNLIKKGYNTELDSYIEAKELGSSWLFNLEQAEREKTGIKGLKIKYNKIFGYFIEVTNKDIKNVPENYIRRQTMSNCERYIIEELKEIEEKILGADEQIQRLEKEIFMHILKTISDEVYVIKNTMEVIAIIDVSVSMAITAEKENYVCPTINDDGIIDIVAGRHAVVEKYSEDEFIPNNTYLDLDYNQVMLITGPNMAGKSTYMRQIALISILFQIGSFVPATKCDICIVDRVFTRVGASDDLWSGKSTFMVEMSEVANILESATNRSLLILDEVGRGTSTQDGLSIAWGILEYIADKKVLGAKTLFSTHYHELTELHVHYDNVHNYHASIKDNGEDIVFLRKIEKGHIDHSYGLHVAKLAGLPDVVLTRAKSILQSLELDDVSKNIYDKDNYIYGNDTIIDDGLYLNEANKTSKA